jgi:hypothetical protein
MLYYGESDYWVAHYRTLTEGSAQQQVHSAGGPRRGLVVRTGALLTKLFGSVARRGVEKWAGLDGRT